jgi:intein-encoded DNA endonuclease-like protein
MLDRLVQEFPFFQKRYDKTKTTTAQLRGNYQRLYDDLSENGVFPKKSTENRLKLNFPNLKEELKPHFIRGFFDGDGSVYMSKTNGPNSKGVSFVGTCKYFMQQLHKKIQLFAIHIR